MTPDEYQETVLRVLASSIQGERVVATGDPLIVCRGGIEFGLQNLYSAYVRDRLGAKDRTEAIQEHFLRMVRELGAKQDLHHQPWPTIEPLLRPQLMPSEYLLRVPLLSFPFTDDVSIGIVLDGSDTYSYVRQEDCVEWRRTDSDLLAIAVSNLDSASAGMEITVSDGPARYVGVEVNDGFDAARILVPGIRALATERLGSPCLAAVPNRDFLFFWAAANPPDFQAFAREKIQQDRDRQPYGLTSTVLSVTASSVAPWADA